MWAGCNQGFSFWFVWFCMVGGYTVLYKHTVSILFRLGTDRIHQTFWEAEFPYVLCLFQGASVPPQMKTLARWLSLFMTCNQIFFRPKKLDLDCSDHFPVEMPRLGPAGWHLAKDLCKPKCQLQVPKLRSWPSISVCDMRAQFLMTRAGSNGVLVQIARTLLFMRGHITQKSCQNIHDVIHHVSCTFRGS